MTLITFAGLSLLKWLLWWHCDFVLDLFIRPVFSVFENYSSWILVLPTLLSIAGAQRRSLPRQTKLIQFTNKFKFRATPKHTIWHTTHPARNWRCENVYELRGIWKKSSKKGTLKIEIYPSFANGIIDCSQRSYFGNAQKFHDCLTRGLFQTY